MLKLLLKNQIMATGKHRKNYNFELKPKAALEAVRGRLTIKKINKQFAVNPNQNSKWKNNFWNPHCRWLKI